LPLRFRRRFPTGTCCGQNRDPDRSRPATRLFRKPLSPG